MTARTRIQLAIRAAVATLIGAIGFAACAPGALATDAGVRPIPSLTAIPTVTLTFTPNISIDHTALDFGDVPVGSSRFLTVTLTNTGSDAKNWFLQGGVPTSKIFVREYAIGIGCFLSTFTSRDTCYIRYTFTPTSLGIVAASSNFSVDYDGAPFALQFQVTLTGCGVGPNGALCPNRPTATATPAAIPTATPRPTDNGGGQTAPQAQSTEGRGAPAATPPLSTGSVGADLASESASDSGSGLAPILVAAAVAALVGGVVTGLLVWRGRRIWEMLTSRRA